MSLFNTATLTVTPRHSGAYVAGVWTGEAAGTPRTIHGSWQPATPREVQTVPEGRRDRTVMKLYTSELLNMETSQNPDRLSVGGRTFELYQRFDLQSGVLSHYKYLAIEIVP